MLCESWVACIFAFCCYREAVLDEANLNMLLPNGWSQPHHIANLSKCIVNPILFGGCLRS